ncbi:hypothetical protein H8L32_21960, partial [Undibacterium sp. CY18W]
MQGEIVPQAWSSAPRIPCFTIPIRVTRTYDTRRKSQNLDFGYGWSVDYQNVQIRKNMILGLQWNV